MHSQKALCALGISVFLLASCGGKTDYSSNPYVKESTTYYQFMQNQHYFTFRKDGTGVLKLDDYAYDLEYTISGDTNVSYTWSGTKGSGVFSTDSSGKRMFTWSGKYFYALN